MRLTASAAELVCSVANARWPVSAIVSAAWIVSRSRISPIRITSGSSRNAYLSALWKLLVSVPTSRWLTMQFLMAVDELDRVFDRDDVAACARD